MSSYYKLIDCIDTTTTLNVARKENDGVKYSHVRLDPGEKYELEEDSVFIESLKGAKIQKKYTKELEAKLKAARIPYEEKYCKTCGSSTKRLEYVVVEVIG